MLVERFINLYKIMSSAGLDAVVFNPGPTLEYLTGLRFHLMERPTLLVIVPSSAPVMILPELEKSKVTSSNPDIECLTYGDDPSTWQAVINKALGRFNLGSKTVGVEPDRFRLLEFDFLQNALPGSKIKPSGKYLQDLRLYKSPEEVSRIKKAVKIAQDALLAALPVVKPGVSEAEIAAELTVQLLRSGSASSFAFDPIVASGPNSANPHAVPGERRVQNGDMLIIDWGAVYQGYTSDLTRTFVVGSVVDNEMYHIASAVSEANSASRETCRPGVSVGQVDLAARQVITQAGYGPYFNHRVGHGIGLEGHEPPYLFAENPLILSPGMTFTIEPGIYLPGRGGVRIEDNMVVTGDGAECLTDLPRHLIALD